MIRTSLVQTDECRHSLGKEDGWMVEWGQKKIFKVTQKFPSYCWACFAWKVLKCRRFDSAGGLKRVGGAAYLSPSGIRPCLHVDPPPPVLLPRPSVNIAMHASHTVLAALRTTHLPTLLHPPTWLHHLFWLAFILPSLPSLIFLCFVHCPASLQLCCPRPALPIVPQAPPISALPLPSDPSVLTSTVSPPSPADRGSAGTPKSSCSSLDCWSPPPLLL